jgi:hypothetical protein
VNRVQWEPEKEKLLCLRVSHTGGEGVFKEMEVVCYILEENHPQRFLPPDTHNPWQPLSHWVQVGPSDFLLKHKMEKLKGLGI